MCDLVAIGYFGGMTKVLQSKNVKVWTLSSLLLFLGSHVFGSFVHSDVYCAFGGVELQLMFEPINGEVVQQISCKDLYALGSVAK